MGRRKPRYRNLEKKVKKNEKMLFSYFSKLLCTEFEISCIFCNFKAKSMLEMYAHEVKCHKNLVPLLRYSKNLILQITAYNCVYCGEHFRNENILMKHQMECKLK